MLLKVFGSYGAVVRLAELKRGGKLYLIWMDARGKQQKLCLGHADRAEGAEAAQQASLAIVKDRDALRRREITLGRLIDSFLERGLRGRSQQYVSDTTRSLKVIGKHLGLDRTVSSLRPRDIDDFVADRREGKVMSPTGKPLRPAKSATTIWHDFVSLNVAINWAVANGDGGLAYNPLRDVTVAKNASPSRPHAIEDLYFSLRAVAPNVAERFGLALDLAFATGRRISAILHLRWENVDFRPREHADHGVILWDRRFDKMKVTG